MERKRTTGHIYVLSNPCFRYLKIGYTTNRPTDRCRQLSNMTAIPKPFKIEFVFLVRNSRKVERKIHQLLENYKYGGEFFDITVDEAEQIITQNFIPYNRDKAIRKIYIQAAKRRPGVTPWDRTFASRIAPLE